MGIAQGVLQHLLEGDFQIGQVDRNGMGRVEGVRLEADARVGVGGADVLLQITDRHRVARIGMGIGGIKAGQQQDRIQQGIERVDLGANLRGVGFALGGFRRTLQQVEADANLRQGGLKLVGGIPNEAGENLRPLLFQRDLEAFLFQGAAKADVGARADEGDGRGDDQRNQ